MNEGNSSSTVAGADNEVEQPVLDFIRENGSITRKEVETTMDMNQTAAGRLLSK